MASPNAAPPTPLRYRVRFADLATQLLPSLLRRPRLVAWLAALLSPLEMLYQDFVAYQRATFRELAYSSQTLVFEGALNDQFDPYTRRIRIVNQEVELTPLYLNFRDENQPDEKFIGFTVEGRPFRYCYQYTEFDTQLDFIVRVPSALRSPERTTQLNARINRFRYATKKYAIRYV